MSPYKEWEKYHYAFATESSLTDPIREILDQSTEDCLHGDRQNLFDFMHGAFCSSFFNDYEEEQLSEYMHFIERMFRLLEVSHRMAELHRKGQFIYSYVGDTSPK